MRRICKVEGIEFISILDTGADVNLVTIEVATQVGAPLKSAGSTVLVVGGSVIVDKIVEVSLEIDKVKDTIKAYVVKEAPVDVVLGEPFLIKHSEGYRRMLEEFPNARITRKPSVITCTIINRERLERLLDKYPQLILEKDQLPPKDRYYKGQTFELGIPDSERNKTFFRAQYPPNPQQIEQFRKLLLPLMRTGVYRPSKSPHNNPVMLVPKKNPGESRMVVDIRQVNKVCKPSGGMSAATLDIIRVMNGAKVFTTLDCKNAFYSLVLAEKDREFTAISPPGLPRMELTRMPMGAKASTAALYQAMCNTLGETMFVYTLVWADDIMVYSKSFEEHIRHVDDILSRLDENGFCISRDKIALGMRQVKWLGYDISDKGIRPDNEKVEKILTLRRPQNVKELRSALGMWTYFASFIPKYSIIAAPLMRLLTKENKPLEWTAEREQAWKEIKAGLANAPIMAYPDYSLELYMHTDACKSGFAAILTQIQRGDRVMVDATSRTTSPSEKNYSSAQLECACVIWAARKWKHHLYAAPHTTIITDSYGLQYLQQKKETSALVQRWICEMEGFNYNVLYRRGPDNIADYLSRQNDVALAVQTRSKTAKDRPDYAKMIEGIRVRKAIERREHAIKQREAAKRIKQPRKPLGCKGTTLDIACLIWEQKKDMYVQKLWRLSQGWNVGEVTEMERQDATLVDKVAGVIVKREKDVTGKYYARIIVPLKLQRQVVEEVHNRTHSGFLGTYRAVRIDHWFRGMKQVVKDVVKHCKRCIAVKGRPRTKETLDPDERPTALGDRWHIDGLQLRPSMGYDHLMVATDVATKYVILMKADGESAQAATDILMEITSRFGPPRMVTTDQGRAFMSRLFMEACRDLLIRFKAVGVGRPQANGMVERVNRTLTEIGTLVCNGDDEFWPKYVKEMEYVINTRISSVTGFSPYELVYGRRPPAPTYVMELREEERDNTKEEERIKELRKRIMVLQRLAHENQMKAAKQQLTYHDAHARAHTFDVNDTVWLFKQSSAERGVTSKLKEKWKGPYLIERVMGDKTYMLKDGNNKMLPGTYHSRDMYKVDP